MVGKEKDSSEREYTPLERDKKQDVYQINGFSPIIINDLFIKDLGITANIDPQTIQGLTEGSLRFERLYHKGQLTAPKTYTTQKSPKKELEIHNYTGMCPTNVLEVTPSSGSCSVSCLYCLVSDGDQVKPIVVYEDYPKIVEKSLKEYKDKNTFFYFSPKTDAFSEPLLETGISHEILRRFIEHYHSNPNSRARLFIASKAAPKHLRAKDKGESILDLFSQLSGKMQFNPSIGIMPRFLHQILEPNAPSLEDRLDSAMVCKKIRVYSKSVLAQPIIPCYLSRESAESFLGKMANAGITNIKPEFLTVNMENIAIISQYINHFDQSRLKEFLELYITQQNKDHIKQRCRTAPNKGFSLNGIKLLHRLAAEKSISIVL